MKIKDWAGKIKQEAEEEVRAKNLIEVMKPQKRILLYAPIELRWK